MKRASKLTSLVIAAGGFLIVEKWSPGFNDSSSLGFLRPLWIVRYWDGLVGKHYILVWLFVSFLSGLHRKQVALDVRLTGIFGLDELGVSVY